MTALLARKRYAGRYPLQGQVAVLCEGDLAGYESDLLARLTAQYGYVDVWPCGTKASIFGMTDAIGRAVPIVAIEDRDFRTPEEAAAECKKNLRDRVENRGVRMHAWRAWHRNEIENYLIEPTAIAPAFAQAFAVDEQQVLALLGNLLPSLVVDQAASWTIARFQGGLPDRHRYVPGLPRETARPRWADADRAVVAPEPTAVRSELENALERKLRAFDTKRHGLEVGTLIADFDSKCQEWAGPRLDSQTWRIDWSGKEVLAWLRRWFAADPGWWSEHRTERHGVAWQALSKDDSPALDRAIESALQPYLVRRFIEHLEQQPNDEIAAEWNELVSSVASAMQSSSQR
jgi:hypothetical protein